MGAPLPQPWTGHRSVVPVEASFIDAIRRGSVVEFSTAPAVDAPRMRGQLVASQVGPEFYWKQFDAQGRDTGTREVRADEVEDLVHGLAAPELVPVAWLDSVSGVELVRLSARLYALLAELQAATGLQRARIAGELATMVGGTIPAMPEKPKHSPEQLAKWAAEKRVRESAQAAKAEADRSEARQRSARSMDRIKATSMWGEFTTTEREDIAFYDDPRDQAEEGRRAVVAAIGRALKAAGVVIDKESTSQDGKSLSIYADVGGEVVRISDHELPMTARRLNDRSRGLSGRWSREVIVTDWSEATMAGYMADVLGADGAQRLGYDTLSDGAQQEQDQGSGGG